VHSKSLPISHLSHFKEKQINRPCYYGTIFAHFGPVMARRLGWWWCWGVMAPDQGQPSYINGYMVYLLVAHRVQRDYSDGLCCQACIPDVSACTYRIYPQSQRIPCCPPDTSHTLKINTSVNHITTVLFLLTLGSRITGSASGGGGGYGFGSGTTELYKQLCT
jgi:hypothetical protein